MRAWMILCMIMEFELKKFIDLTCNVMLESCFYKHGKLLGQMLFEWIDEENNMLLFLRVRPRSGWEDWNWID